MSTIVRDDAPETPPESTDRQILALDLLHIAARDLRRTSQPHHDRALAHAIRAGIRCGLVWRTICAATGTSQGQLTECLIRWPGDN